MTPQELKNSILQLAIQGKLVEQRAEEGTGRELLEKILAVKNAEGAKGRGNKLTRSRGVRGDGENEGISNLPKAAKSHHGKLSALSASPREEIPDDEKPFDIPESWEWVRFGVIGQLLDGEKREGKTYPCLDAKFLRGKCEAKYLTSGKFVSKGDKVILVDGENSGEVFVVPQDGYMGSTFKVLYCSPVLFASYILSFLSYHQKDYRNNKKGAAIPHLNKDLFFNMPFPLPPLAEQKRIVAKIEELMPLVERYEKAWSRLEDFNKRFPADMQKSLLQMAIQGKLVEQRAEEGTGRELLEKILAAKNAKGAKGREIKHTRSRGVRGGSEDEGISNLPKAAKSHHGKLSALSASPREEIPDDEKPFEIPESWEWVRLGECSSYAEKKEKIIPSEIKPDDWSLDLEDIEKDTGRIIEFRLARDRRIIGDKVVFRKGQILYSKLRPYLKKILIAPNDGICTPELVPFSALGGIDARYLVVVLKSPHVDFVINSVTYGVKMPRVGTETMVSLPIPLPPLAEQKRIVAKLEELLPLCERLK